MATTKDWTAATLPVSTHYFAGGDATDWCEHTPPSWARVISVKNDGSGILYVSFPALTGTAASTDDCESIAAGSARTFVLAPQTEAADPPTFSTWGADGASHATRITFERSP